ncbi:phage head-tail connector protein [Paenibacillus chitinolyticus]
MVTSSGIWSLVKKRLGITDNLHDELIEMYTDEVGQRILHYINRQDVPDGLKHTWAAITAGALTKEQSAIIFPQAQPVEAYEVKLGDTSVKPIKAPESPPQIRPTVVAIDSELLGYKADLNAYRKLRW